MTAFYGLQTLDNRKISGNFLVVFATKAKLVRRIPETFKGLGLSQQTAFCPQKTMLSGINQLILCHFQINKVQSQIVIPFSLKNTTSSFVAFTINAIFSCDIVANHNFPFRQKQMSSGILLSIGRNIFGICNNCFLLSLQQQQTTII